MILITGATGNLGSKVIETLLKHIPSSEIAALIRDESKAGALKDQGISIKIGDYDDIAALNEAMQGITKVLLVSGGRAENGLQQHQNVVDAAKNAGVKCLAYTSRCLKDRNSLANDLMKRHFETEDYIIASGLNYIFFRNILYMDSMVLLLGPQVLDTGIYLPAGEGKGSYALRSDQAEAIGNVLALEDDSSRIFNFTNSRTYTFDEVAEVMSELSGKPITYRPLEPDTFRQKANDSGLPEFLTEMTIGFAVDIKNGQESTVSNDLETALGRSPLHLRAGLKVLLGL